MSTWNDDDNTTLDGLADDGAPAVSRPADGERYLLGETLGQGGMGEVKAAIDRKLRREVALKVLSVESPAGRDRFYAEAQVTAKLEHPNIVPVHDLGTTREGRPFLAMKRVRGAALSEALPAMGLEARLEVFRKVCDAVAFAHSRGVLHRDLKPENVMVGEFGEVLLMDWGLARAADGGSSLGVNRFEDDSRRTRDGQVAGTPAYMAPEQAAGQLDRVGERTDVYGLGAILYELLVGEAPYSGSASEVLRAVRAGELRPPRARRATVPRELDAVVCRAMAPRPEDRYQTVKALREDIDAWLAHQPLVHVRSSASERLAKWAARHRSAVQAGGSVGLLALGALVLGLWRYANDIGQARDEALAEAGRARVAEARALQGLIAAKVGLADALIAQGDLSEAGQRLSEAAGLAAGREVDRRPLDLALSVQATLSPLPLSRCHPHGEQPVNDVALSPDGERAISRGGDGRIVEWSVSDCATLAALELPGKATLGALSWSEEEPSFAVIVDGALRRGELQRGWGPPQALAGDPWSLSLRGDRAVVGLQDAGAQVFEGERAQLLPGPPRHRAVPHLASGLWLVPGTGADPEPGGLWRLPSQAAIVEEMGLTGLDTDSQGALALHATAAGYGVLDLTHGRELWAHPGWAALRVGVSPNDALGWALGFDGVLKLFDLRSGGALWAFSGPTGSSVVALSRDGRVISLANPSGEVATFLRPLRDPRWLPLSARPAQGLALSADGQAVYLADDDGVVQKADLLSGEVLWTAGPYAEGARQIAVSPDGARLAVALRGSGLAVLDAASGAELLRLATPARTVSVAWLSDERLATLPVDGRLRVYEAATGALLVESSALRSASWDLTPVGEGRVFAATHITLGSERALLDAEGRTLWRQDSNATAYQHALSPDGQRLAVARHDGKVELLDLTDGHQISILDTDNGPTMAVAFSPDGSLLATGGFSERVMIWDARTGERLRSERQHVGPVLNLVFTVDGSAVLSTGANGGLAVLPLRAHQGHAEAVLGLQGDLLSQARSFAALGWWERVPATLDAALAAGLPDDPALRRRAEQLNQRAP